MPSAPIRATTQDFLDIADVTNNIILLKDGSVAMVIQTSAVNFGLLSEQEQEATIYAYAALLNSLTFPIQILIRSQKKDITNYLKLLENQEKKLRLSVRKNQIRKYRQFISQIVKEGNVLDKKFYCIIPFSRIELGLSASNPLSLKKHTALPYDKSYIISKATTVLEPKRDHLIRQFARIGLTAKQLTTQELTQLLYNVYNPDSARGVKLAEAKQYNTLMVAPAHQQKEVKKTMDEDTNPTQPTPTAEPTTPAPAPTEPTTPTPTPPTEPTTPTAPPDDTGQTPPTAQEPPETPSSTEAQSTINQAAASSPTPTPTAEPTIPTPPAASPTIEPES